MDPLIILVFVLLVGFIFVILTRWQRSSDPDDAAGCCGHQHGPDCNHQHDHHHHDHKDGGCCGGKH